ncbi:hypothetical protein Avbf_03473 [Armadillidium vulgare]|nr:hypothetical protein Avbf_03473 [Armadillidium vulgare]
MMVDGFIKPKQRKIQCDTYFSRFAKRTFRILSSHNFEYLLKNISPYSCSTYSPLGTVDTEEGILAPCSWGHEQGNMSSLLRLQNIPRKSSYETKNIRDEFAEYFTAVGKVAWQHNYSQLLIKIFYYFLYIDSLFCIHSLIL